MDVLIVQHGEKIEAAGNHGLTGRGRQQAEACGRRLARLGPFDEIWTSPLVRARRTAWIIAPEIPLLDREIREDLRLTERVNWWDANDQDAQAFATDWMRSTRDRDYSPYGGDSSRSTANRMADFLQERRRATPTGRILVVSHGGATMDLCRTWFGDDRVEDLAPGAIEHGVTPCGVTWIELEIDRRALLTVGSETLPART